MELTAVIKAIEFVREKDKSVEEINVISDSQYVIGLIAREEKFIASNFKTKKEADIRNVDLVVPFLKLTKQIHVIFTKIKAHQQPTSTANYNIEADILARHLVREAVAKLNIE